MNNTLKRFPRKSGNARCVWYSSLDYLTPHEFKQQHPFINQGAVLK
jgi:hypothetical protein